MSQNTKKMRDGVSSALDALEMLNFAEGFDSAIDGIDELSNLKHNQGDLVAAEVLRWAAKELRGENA